MKPTNKMGVSRRRTRSATREFWQLLVYCSEEAVGNPTGVVFLEEEPAPEECLRLAASLGYPDTVFVSRTEDPVIWSARAFSPAEELSFCTQGLIAAFQAIRRKHRSLPSQGVRFVTRGGLVEVTEESDLAWVTAPYRVVGAAPAPQFLASAGQDLLVDTGRIRLLREFKHPDELEDLQPDPTAVLAFCRRHNISGLCLFARCAPQRIRARVFTTSLDGREDASTGGAAMAILPYLLDRRILALDEARNIWTIQQGSGPRYRRGTLYTRIPEGGQRTFVGGRHRVVARGRILPA